MHFLLGSGPLWLPCFLERTGRLTHRSIELHSSPDCSSELNPQVGQYLQIICMNYSFPTKKKTPAYCWETSEELQNALKKFQITFSKFAWCKWAVNKSFINIWGRLWNILPCLWSEWIKATSKETRAATIGLPYGDPIHFSNWAVRTEFKWLLTCFAPCRHQTGHFIDFECPPHHSLLYCYTQKEITGLSYGNRARVQQRNWITPAVFIIYVDLIQ